MKERAVLQVVLDGGDGIAMPVHRVASCATCKWAEASTHIGGEWDSVGTRLAAVGFPLRCKQAEMEPVQYDNPNLEARLCVTMDGSEYRGDLYVKPDFGCVQWEGK